MKCPKCKASMHVNTVIIFGGNNLHYSECPDCGYKTEKR